MVPDLDLRLQVVTTTLADVAARSAAGEPVAPELVQLAIATNEQTREMLPAARRIAARELDAVLDMARKVAAETSSASLAETMTAAEQALDDVDADANRLNACRAGLLSAIGELIRKLPEGGDHSAIFRIVLRGSREAIDVARACYLPCGFEVDPDDQARLARLRDELLHR